MKIYEFDDEPDFTPRPDFWSRFASLIFLFGMALVIGIIIKEPLIQLIMLSFPGGR